MAKRREFGEGPVYIATNYIMWFFLGNFYFLLCNIPLIFVAFSFSGQFIAEYTVLLVLASLPIGPAYTALLSTMGRLVREKDISVSKNYFSAYKANFLQSLFIWTLQIVATIIFVVDIRYFASNTFGKFVVPVLYAAILLNFCAGIYIYPILSRFYLKTKDIIKLSFYFIVKRWRVTISCISIFIVSSAVAYKFVSIAAFFIVSLTCFAIMYLQRDIIKELEEKFKQG